MRVQYHQGPHGPVYTIYGAGGRQVAQVSYLIKKNKNDEYEQQIRCDEHNEHDCPHKVTVEQFRKQDAREALELLGVLNIPKLK